MHLVTVVRFSGGPILHHFKSSAMDELLVNVSRELCCTYGKLGEISSDPQFISSKFSTFLTD